MCDTIYGLGKGGDILDMQFAHGGGLFPLAAMGVCFHIPHHLLECGIKGGMGYKIANEGFFFLDEGNFAQSAVMCADSQPCAKPKGFHFGLYGTKSVFHFVLNVVECLGMCGVGDILIEMQSLCIVGDIVFRDSQIDIGFQEAKRGICVSGVCGVDIFDYFLENMVIGMESDFMHHSALFCAEQISGTS